jgi:hypothetical protein
MIVAIGYRQRDLNLDTRGAVRDIASNTMTSGTCRSWVRSLLPRRRMQKGGSQALSQQLNRGATMKLPKNQIPKGTMRYVSGIPKKIPDGWVLVHNQVVPQRRLGLNGFRAWLEKLGSRDPSAPPLVRCECDWAGRNANGEIPHYRVDISKHGEKGNS